MKPYLQEKLNGDDNTLFKKGACHVFADELFPRFASHGFSLRRLADTNATSDQMQALHVYLVRDDVMFDVGGRGSEATYIQEAIDYRTKTGGPVPSFCPIPCSRDELFTAVVRECDDERGLRNHWWHFLDEEFIAECRRRAKLLIDQFPEKYCP
jgi:hypothetical protein